MERLTADDGGNHTAKVHNDARRVNGESRTPKESHSADSRDNKRKMKGKNYGKSNIITID